MAQPRPRLLTQERERQLDELRIERSPAANGRDGRRRVARYLAATCVVAAGVGGLWFGRSGYFAARPTVTVQSPHFLEAAAAANGVSLEAEGYVVARRVATVSAKTTGRVREVDIEEGQPIERGQVIARLDDSNIAAAREQVRAALSRTIQSREAARIAVQDALPLLQRQYYLARLRVASQTSYETQKAAYDAALTAYRVQQQDVAEAQAAVVSADKAEDDTIVTAPFKGVVTVKAAQIGEIVSPISAGGGFTRTGLCTIVDMDSIEIETDVSESFIHQIAPGQQAIVRLNAYPDRDLPGHVLLVIPMADRAKATIKVRVVLDHRPDWVFPEMAVRVAFLPQSDKRDRQAPNSPVLLVPATAVHQGGVAGSAYVFVVQDGSVRKQPVVTDKVIGSDQIILSGLKQADTVVIKGDHVVAGQYVDVAPLQ